MPKQKYKLKKGPAFEIVDGPLAGRKFAPGKVYTEIPEGMENRFKEVAEPKAPAKAEIKPKTKKKGGE